MAEENCMTQENLNNNIQKNNILKQVIQKIEPKLPEKLHSALCSFIEIFYDNVSLEDLTEQSIDSLAQASFETWGFCQERTPGSFKIRACIQKREIKGNLVPQTVVEVLNENMPFLVDSVAGAINSLGYSIRLIIHPVIQVERDHHNNIVKVRERKETTKNGKYESIIRCEIPELITEGKLKILENEISKSLLAAAEAVKDWLPMRERLREIIQDLEVQKIPFPKDELDENIAFLKWIEDHHYTFLGFCEFTINQKSSEQKEWLIPHEGLGILKGGLREKITHLFQGIELNAKNQSYLMESGPLIITKTSQVSLVHRRDPMDSITIKKYDKEGKVIGLYEFIGLFTSVAYHRSVRTIPLLRLKAAHILERSGFSEEWHDGKTLVHLIETFPRDEFFQASEDWLFDTLMAILQLQNRQRLTLFIRPDNFKRFISCIVYVPRERYDSELRKKICAILENSLKGRASGWQVQLGELAFARLHFTIKIFDPKDTSFDLQDIKRKILEASLTWRDNLQEALIDSEGEEKGQELFEKYGYGFSKGYQERFAVTDAIIDIHEIESAFEHAELRSHLNSLDDNESNKLQLKLYSLQGPLVLSNILPVLENMNLKALGEIPFVVHLPQGEKAWVHVFELQTWEGDLVDVKRIRTNFLEGFRKIWSGEVENDGFNRLILRANFDWRECQLIRAYAKYLRQLQVTFSQTYMEEVLAKYPHICHFIFQMFSCQFSPESKDSRQEARLEILNRIKSLIENVESLDEDRILWKFVNVIGATLRTNYFQIQNNEPKNYVSLKIDCAAVNEMPLPRPMYEIFVYSACVEAIHLRGGKVARGGIRWSDRKEDFRTEILGLMKAQIVKNAVIVPVGSKGGFIMKRSLTRYDQASLMKEVIDCYKVMMCGLLDLTDNIQQGKIVKPDRVICRDDDDPYLVVAADKGTSTFSDYANQISAEYNFWLGDAFASGGSTGYDHKKMGITARGAWESVKRHFKEMDIDADRETLTVAGIGDMSGDVFGNGMLLSKHLKLVASFNHLHIFIDPDPHPEKSFLERKRLFEMPRSSWLDYNPDLISKGGGVFDRGAKSITLTPQIKTLLDIKEDQLIPSDLIRYILMAQVDLLWFGGVGTYIKSKAEKNSEVGDRANDAVRINGSEAKARVIAEGANLGITQLGRIEYAKKGGRINTDAIDNSAGVDCSDHEVNIKILLGKILEKDEITIEKRDRLLEEMTDSVAASVIKDNFWQNQVISMAESQGFSQLDEQVGLMRELESDGLLNRSLEGLPDETEIASRISEKYGLTRPELAVLLAYSKISLKHQLLKSELPDLKILQQRLMSYFPEKLQLSYENEILSHPLKREITATLYTNSIINRMGISYIHEMKNRSGADGSDVARAHLIVRDLLELISLWRDLESLQTLPSNFQMELMLLVNESVKRFTDWFLRFLPTYRDITGTIEFFKQDFEILRHEFINLFTPEQQDEYRNKCAEYEQLGLSPSLSSRILSLNPLVSAPDMIMLSKDLGVDIKRVAKIYFALDQQLGLEWLRKSAMALSGDNHWQQGAANAIIEDLYAHQKELTALILKRSRTHENIFTDNGKIKPEVIDLSSLESLLDDVKNASPIDFSMMTVMNSRLRMIGFGP